MKPVLSEVRSLARKTGVRRHHVANTRLWCERNGLGIAGAKRTKPGGRILAYHATGSPEWGINDMAPARFRAQLEWALEHGYRFVPATTIADGCGEPRDLAVTFDDGLASVAENAAPILSELGIPWTMFVVSGFAEPQERFRPGLMLDWRGVEAIAAMGASVGSHSVTHRNIGSLTDGEAVEEVLASADAIQRRTGLVVSEMAIPFGKAKDWSAAAQGAAAGRYRHVYAYCEQRRYPGTVGRSPVTAYDHLRNFRAILEGRYDNWHEWVW